MHILFSPEEASGVREFGMAFNKRFKHVNRLCERYFPPSHLSSPFLMDMHSYFVQNVCLLSFTFILHRKQFSQTLGCQTPYLWGVLHFFVSYCSSASLIKLQICSKRSAFTRFSTRRRQIPCSHGRVVHRRLNSVGKSSGVRQVSKTDDHSWQLLLFPSWTWSLVP